MNSPLRFIPDIFLKRRIIHLTVFLTSRCNARCGFCFSKDLPSTGDELSFEELKSISKNSGPLLWLSFSGGEPFLRDDLTEIARAFYEHTQPSIILISTNGLMPDRIRQKTEEILKAAPQSVVAVKLSLDGLGELHDQIRGVDGTFERVNETCRALSPLVKSYRNFELGVNTVFCADNQDEIEAVAAHVSTMPGIRTHTVSLIRGDEAARVDPAKYLNAARLLERGLKSSAQPVYGFSGARIKAAQDIIQRGLIHRALCGRPARMRCHAGRLNAVITETGGVYPCERFTVDMFMGNIRDRSFDINEVLRSDKARHVIKRIAAGCSCTHECYIMTNVLFSPRFYPQLLRETLALNPLSRG